MDASTRIISMRGMFDIYHQVDANGDPVPFSIEFTTYDRTRKGKPSRHVRIDRAVKAGAAHDIVRHRQITIQPLDPGYPKRISIHIHGVDKINGMVPL
jgi:hypothetical protein